MNRDGSDPFGDRTWSAGGPSAGGPSAGGPSAGGPSAGGPSAGGSSAGAPGPGASDVGGSSAGNPWWETPARNAGVDGHLPDIVGRGPEADPAAPAASAEEKTTGWRARRTSIAGAVVAGIAATALGVGVVHASGSSRTGSSGGNTALGGARPGQGQFPGGPDGETHVSGTITAVTASSVTVRQISGTSATYTVDSSSQVLDNGKTVAVTALTTGEQVLVHAFARTGTAAYAERVLAGSSATAGPTGGMPSGPDGGGADGGGPDNGTGTGAAPGAGSTGTTNRTT